MQALKEKELLILTTLIEGNSDRFGFLKSHLDFICVESRKTTGNSLTVNLGYTKTFDEAEFVNALITSEEKLRSPQLKNELTYCLDITNGKLDFLEISTNGNEIWNAALDNCNFSKD